MDWLFWDNDGVLVATEELYYRACAEALARVGVDLDLPTFRTISLQRGESVFQLVAESRGREARESLRSWRDARYGELLAGGVALLPEAKETLERLRGRVRMAIVTSCRREHFAVMHRDSGLLDYFDFVLMREDYHHSKPHPEPYLLALARSGAKPGRCVVIEDSPRGAQAAARAGLACIVIPGTMNAAGDFSSARWRIERLGEIPDLLGLDPCQ
jgi:HAD superfamily hydrolase (TIGR01509 family)